MLKEKTGPVLLAQPGYEKGRQGISDVVCVGFGAGRGYGKGVDNLGVAGAYARNSGGLKYG
jgi:hypothetical protein